MRMKSHLSILVLIFLALSCTRLPDEFPAPDFSVEDIFTGEEIHLESFRGRPVVLYFFASW